MTQPTTTQSAAERQALAINAVLGERRYQEQKWPDHQHGVAEWLLIIEKLCADARREWVTGHGDNGALHEVRQITATGLACLEQCGSPARGESTTGKKYNSEGGKIVSPAPITAPESAESLVGLKCPVIGCGGELQKSNSKWSRCSLCQSCYYILALRMLRAAQAEPQGVELERWAGIARVISISGLESVKDYLVSHAEYNHAAAVRDTIEALRTYSKPLPASAETRTPRGDALCSETRKYLEDRQQFFPIRVATQELSDAIAAYESLPPAPNYDALVRLAEYIVKNDKHTQYQVTAMARDALAGIAPQHEMRAVGEAVKALERWIVYTLKILRSEDKYNATAGRLEDKFSLLQSALAATTRDAKGAQQG